MHIVHHKFSSKKKGIYNRSQATQTLSNVKNKHCVQFHSLTSDSLKRSPHQSLFIPRRICVLSLSHTLSLYLHKGSFNSHRTKRPYIYSVVHRAKLVYDKHAGRVQVVLTGFYIYISDTRHCLSFPANTPSGAMGSQVFSFKSQL